QSAADEKGGQHHGGSLTLPCRVKHLTGHGFASPGCPSDDGAARYGKIMINDNPLQVAAEPGKGGRCHRKNNVRAVPKRDGFTIGLAA
ncbi:MAG: hypothetical protein LGL72_15275, partial [Acidibrevibacterium sp.]|uniref:hypothetical protein n=1 Tax=Acidibrevibacterium fodinaquatile TaxID=1969806 RepID=UPI0023A79494